MELERKNYAQLGEPVGPYAHAVKHNGVLHLSGITAFGTEAEQGDIATQTHAIFDQIGQLAELEGSSLKRIIKATIFVTSLSDIDSLRDALFKGYNGHLPASSLIEVSALFLPELKIEIEAMIAVD